MQTLFISYAIIMVAIFYHFLLMTNAFIFQVLSLLWLGAVSGFSLTKPLQHGCTHTVIKIHASTASSSSLSPQIKMS